MTYLPTRQLGIKTSESQIPASEVTSGHLQYKTIKPELCQAVTGSCQDLISESIAKTSCFRHHEQSANITPPSQPNSQISAVPVIGDMFGRMAALIPIISEILPMIMPSSISVTKASEILSPILPVSADDTTTEHQNGSADEKQKKPEIKVISRDALVNKTDKMCASVLIIPPKSSSTIRHNGEQDAIIYAASGSGILLSSPKDDEEPVTITAPKPTTPDLNGAQGVDVPKEEEVIIQEPQPVRYPIEKGDFAFIPAWTEHQAVNESDTEQAIWVVIRSGSSPVEVHLTEWGGAEVKEAKEEPSSTAKLLERTLFNIR